MTTSVPQIVLLIGDAPGDAHLIRMLLQEAGVDAFKVHLAESLTQAQVLIRAEGLQPDVVLLDLNLPDATGIATVQRCRALIDAPIVVLTGMDDDLTNQAVIQSGAEDHLPKGGSVAALRKALRYAILRNQRDADARLASAVLKQSHDGIMITDFAGLILEVNPAFCQISGYQAEELIGLPHHRLIQQDWQADVAEDFQRSLKQQGFWQGEVVRHRKDGKRIDVAVSVTLNRSATGRVKHFIVSLVDITERKWAMAEMRRSTQLLRNAIDCIDEAFVLYDGDDRLMMCNDKFREFYATSADLIVAGARFEALIRQGAERGQYPAAIGRVNEWVAERMAFHQAANSTLIQHLDDGRILRIVERRLADGSTVGYRIDITDLVRATENAQAASQAKSRFLATMSHEIRTPMNGILGMAQLLLTPNLTDHKRQDYARTVLNSGQSLLALLNDILDLSKIEAGKFQLDNSTLAPEQLLHETLALFSGAAKNKNLSLLEQWHGVPGQRYQTDGHRLRQMLSNLVGNAIKFTPQGEVCMEAIELERDGQSAMLEFAVIDTGIGVPADKLKLLFQPFSQTDSSTTRQFGGSGLGLSIVSSLAKLLGGDVGVQSEPGKGSRFWFRVRAQVLAAGEEGRSNTRAEPYIVHAANPAAVLTGRVLVAEDNSVNRMVIEGLLSQLGLAVTFAHDGQQAVAQIRSGDAPDVILMDLHMPVMDGYTAAQHIRQWETNHQLPRVPIIALTADAFEEDHQHCLAVGMDDFLAKPIALDDLRQALGTWLAASMPRATPVAARKAVNPTQFAAMTAELLPMLQENRFDAIERAKALRDMLAGTELAPQAEQLLVVLNTFDFPQTTRCLRSMIDQVTTKLTS